MAAKAVVIHGNDNQPLANVEVAFADNHREEFFPLTNSDGYALSPISWNAWSGYVRVVANGYASYIQLLTLDDNDQEVHINVPGGPPNTIHLPGLVQGFKKPTRDQIVNVQANFCNLLDSEGMPIDESFIDQLIYINDPKADDWVRILKAAGSKHITLTLTGDYNENLGWAPRYPIAGHDWTNDLSGFAAILKWVQSRGLIPLTKLGFDGQGYDPNGWTYGWQWGMDNIDRIANGLSDFNKSMVWSTGWDGCFPNWSPNQLLAMLHKMREVLGEDAVLDTEFSGPGSIGYSHLGNGTSDWADDKLGILDCFSTELQTNPAQVEGIAQTAVRLLGPNSKNCPAGPYYLENTSKKINMCFFETVAYWAIRKYLTPEQIMAPSQLGQYYGFTSFGNGVPTN